MRIGPCIGIGAGGGGVADGLAGLAALNLTEFWRPEKGVDSVAALSVWTGQKTGATLAQATAAKKPAVTSGVLGGRAALVGAPGGTVLTGKRLDNGTVIFGTSFTVIVVAAWVDPGAELVNTRIVDWQPGANRLIGKYGTNTWKVFNGAFFGSTAAATGTPVILTYKQANGVGGTLYINGTSVGTNATNVLATTGFSVLGNNTVAAEYHEGYLGTVGVHATSALSDADRLAVERLLGAYYGVTVA